VPHLYTLLGKQIAGFRRKAGLTQEQLAELTGYSVDFIGLVERGINAPTVARLEDIAAALHVEVWQLFRDSAEFGPQKSVPKRRGHSRGTRK
jgi:transcriptional regulator with XRE-family HTH domain